MKNKKLIFVFIVVIYTCLAFTAINIGEVKADTVASERLFRLYNPFTGEHFYTKSKDEKNQLVQLGWRDEDIAWYGVSLPSPMIVDLSEYQAPKSIDYDKLANQIDGAIVRVYNGNRADNSFQTHIEELKKRGIPVAVYAYVMADDNVE